MTSLQTATTLPPFIPRKSDRLDRAILLVERNAVTLVGRGSYTVQGSKGGFYSVVAVTLDGERAFECNCPDAHYRTGGELVVNACKHSFAVAIVAGS